jgi:hypothetical protein
VGCGYFGFALFALLCEAFFFSSPFEGSSFPCGGSLCIKTCGLKRGGRREEFWVMGETRMAILGQAQLLLFLLLACTCIFLSCAEVIFEERFEG